MNKYLKKIIALLLAFVLLISCYVPSFALSDSQINKLDGNWGTRDKVCTTLSSDAVSYYSKNGVSYDSLSDDGATAIKNSISSLMKSTHSYTSSYNDCHYAAHKTDCENNNGKITLIYTSYQATQNQWNGWNREHVWPQSLGGNNTSGGGADLHHIRPSDAGVNSSRGNKKYGNVNGGTEKYGSNPATGYLGGTYSSTYFEPNDNVKGDVARICLYVLVRWGSAWGADSITEVFQSVDVLLEWCEMDPVDTWEMGRNDVIEEIQGNRNVFIDYPEYAWLIFGEAVPEGMTTPSGSANPENNGSGGNSSHPHSFTSSVTKQPTCTEAGVETFVCSCGYTYTKSISATGHNYTWSVTKQPTCTETGVKTFVCTCGSSYTQSIASTGHSYSSSVTLEPTCTETGVKTFSCSCGTSYTQPIAKIAHTYVEGVCSSCGDVEDTTGGEICQHTNTEKRNEKIPTCKNEGYSGDIYCTDCDELLTVGDVLHSTSGHNFSQWQIAEDGVTQYRYCLDCGARETAEVGGIFDGVTSDAELILLLIALGCADKIFIDEIGE